MLCCSNIIYGSRAACTFLLYFFPRLQPQQIEISPHALSLMRRVSRVFSCLSVVATLASSNVFHPPTPPPPPFPTTNAFFGATPQLLSVTHGCGICYAGSRDQVGVCQSQSRCFTLVSRPAAPPPPGLWNVSLCLSLLHTYTNNRPGQLSLISGFCDLLQR